MYMWLPQFVKQGFLCVFPKCIWCITSSVKFSSYIHHCILWGWYTVEHLIKLKDYLLRNGTVGSSNYRATILSKIVAVTLYDDTTVVKSLYYTHQKSKSHWCLLYGSCSGFCSLSICACLYPFLQSSYDFLHFFLCGLQCNSCCITFQGQLHSFTISKSLFLQTVEVSSIEVTNFQISKLLGLVKLHFF